MKFFIQCLVVCMLLSTIKSKAQNSYLMNSNKTINLSEGIIFDDGGQNHNVSNTANVTTFKGTNGILELYFTDFNIPYDAVLKIYDGTSINGTLLGSFRSQDKPWNFKAQNITIEYIPSSSNAIGRGWRGVLKTSNIVKNPTVQSAPESDCPQAIPLCANNTAIVSASQYVDIGSINDDSGSCYGGTGSGGSVWYTFTPQSTGPLDFLIIPSGSTDYDFVVWDITNGCSSKTQVLCNYSATHGNTGAASGGASASEGSSGSLLCTRPTVTVGRQYAICINFYGGSNDGYTLQFQNEASSVAITDNIPPTITYVTGNGCTNTTVLDVYFSEWINCTTLQIGDFSMPGHAFTMLNNYCNGGKTNHVQLSVSPALTAVAGTPTTYTLSVLNTGAGTSMNDMCGNPMNVNYVITLGQTPTANAGPDKYNCKSPGLLGIGYNYSSVTLNGSGGAAGSIYNWSDGSTGQSPSVAPTQTTTYTLTVTQGACTATDVVTVFVENQPVVNLGPDVLMCSGLPLSMSASGGGTYQWQVQTGTVFLLGTPTFGNISGATSSTYSTIPTQYASTGSTYYQVNVTSPNGACSASDQIKVTFGAGSFGILSSKPYLCQGESTTLSLPTGMNAYSWSTGTSANAPLTVSPSSTTSYTATSTTAGCTGTAVITVPVRPLPVVVASATPSAICIGNTATLSATPTGSNATITENFESANGFTFVNGANNKWYWGTAAFASGTKGIYIGTAATNNNYDIGNAFTPKTATNHAYKDYTISSYCTSDFSFKWKNSGQAGQAELTVWLVPNTFVPTAGTAITAGAGNILLGGPYYGQTTYQSVTYNLNSYVGQTARIVFQWVNTGAALISGPTVSNPAASIDDVVFNESLTYSYNWNSLPSGLGATTLSLTVTPTVTTAYSVTVTRCDGCSNSASVPLTVLPAAAALTVSPTSTICPGQTTTLTVSGGTSYTWSPSTTLSSSNGSSVTANPTLTTIYTVSSTACGGSINSNTVQVIVNGVPPVIGAINGSTVICPNSTSITYSVSNIANTNYTWSVPPSATITSTPTNSNAITVNFGAAAGTISVSAVNACGTSTASLVVGINPPITLTVTPNTSTICVGSSVTLSASGATNYTWSPSNSLSSANGISVVASPTTNTTYTIVGATGTCTGSTTANISMGGALTLTVTPTNTSVCAGTPVILSASGATNYTWSPSATLSSANGSSVTATPISNTTYTVIGASGTCTGSATANISMSAALTLTLSSNTPTVCPGGSALLDANGATTYTWFPSATLSSANGSNVTASPLAGTTYTVLGSTGTCTGVATISVGIGVCVSSACNLNAIRSALTSAGNIELLGMNNTCSLYFINPQFMTGPQAQAYAQSFGANLISVQSSAENADLVQALSNQGFAGQVIWIGYSDATNEGTFTWYDGSSVSYTNWAPGEPNNAGDEDCTQIYPDGSWNDLNCSGYNSLSIIEVNICPQVTVTTPTIHCPGTNVTLNASTLLGSPGYTYTWVQSGTETFTNTSSPGNTDQITVTSMGANTFTVYSEDRYSCPQFAIANLSVYATPTITANSATICVGQQTATLTASGATTYSWIPGTGLSATSGAVVTGTPSSTQNYTVIGMDANGCMNGTITTIAVNPLPTITVNSATICEGQQTATLVVSGANSYSWSPSAGLNTTFSSTVSSNPSATQIYTIVGSDINGCTANITSTVTVNTLPTVSVNSSTICSGQQTATLIASGANTYSWIPGNNLSSTTGTLVTGTPTISQNYTVVGTDINGCYSSTITAITVNSLPFITTNTASICAGQQTATLTANGANTYTWSPGTGLSATTGTAVTGTPSTTQTYTLSGTDANGCIGNTTTTITVNTLPTITVNNASICIGQQTATLTANGADTYTWNPTSDLSAGTGSLVTGTPSVTQTYTVTGTDVNGCFNSNTTTITVNPLPTISANSATICVGQQTATLTATGASTYSWIPGTGLSATTGSLVTGTPTITQQYTVAGMDINGCINGTVTAITVNPLPTVTVNSATICVGQQTATLTANGATTYSWIPGTGLSATTGSVVTGTPTVTQQYTVAGMDTNGCINGTVTAITVNPLPTLVTSPNTTVCPSSTNTLSTTGANTYTWTPNIFLNTNTASSVICTPSVTTSYTIDATSVDGCTNSTSLTITVNNTVVVTASATTPTICPASTTSLNANGATSYTWSPSASLSSPNGATVTSSTPITETYTVIGATGTCTNSAQVVVTVTTNPVVSVVASPSVICSGSTSSLTASGASTYTWSPVVTPISPNGSVVSSTPNTTTIYNITGASTLGCLGTTSTTITVVPTPTVSAIANPLTICAGKISTLTAIGATNYTWSPSGSISNVNSGVTNANPAFTTTYTVLGSNGTAPNLCFSSNTVQVLVIQNPTITTSPEQVICEGKSTLIYANGALSYTWSPSAGVSDIHDSTTYVNPAGSGVFIYTVTGTNNNCTSSSTVQVTVNPLPIVYAGLDTTINIDNTVTLAGTGNTQVGFINPSDGSALECNYCSTITVNPQNNTCYTLEGINQFGCRATDVVCVYVTKDWNVYIPNAFTPNGDTKNEIFIPMGYAISEIKLTIYDRWGHLVFKSHDETIGWDGTKNGKLCEQGVYVYQAEITAMSGEKVIKTGHVTLLSRVK